MSNPNPVSRDQTALVGRAAPSVHPDYAYWSPVWEKIRDAEIGEIEVKRRGQKYLPKLQGHDKAQYESYLDRAVFFNMTAKTLNALYGTVFRRNPKITGITKTSSPSVLDTKKINKDGSSLNLTAKVAVKEILAVGRYGMLVDAPAEGGSPYVACYTAENIIDWHISEINGVWQFTRVVLREIEYKGDFDSSPYRYVSRYRVLVLEEDEENGYVYEQHVYKDRPVFTHTVNFDKPDEVIVPTVRGQLLDYIPFIILGPFTNHPDVQKPPLLDIVTLNYSHYSSYAQLEQGRFYTAAPVYWTSAGTSGGDDGSVDYYVGPDVVWELGKDGKAGCIEFNGAGLKFLESALDQKEAQISAIGGRMMPGTSRGAAESDNSLTLKEQNEQTLLLNIADTVDEGLTQVLKWWADWRNATKVIVDAVTFEVNRDFILKTSGAREFRAIHQMYADGIIPLDVVWEFLQKAEVIPEWMDKEEYMRLLSDKDQFPNMVDVLAKMQNFPDAATFHEFTRVMPTEAAPSANDPTIPGVPQQARMSTAARNNTR